MKRRCPKCQVEYPDPILFCEQDGSRLVEPQSVPAWKMAVAGAALAIFVAAGAWFGLQEYLASTVALELVDLRPPAVRSDGSGFLTDSGSVSFQLTLKNRSRLAFMLQDASFEIELGNATLPSRLRPKERLPVPLGPGATFAINLESGNLGQRQLASSTYDLAVRAHYRVEVWGLPLEFPGVALARVRIDKKK